MASACYRRGPSQLFPPSSDAFLIPACALSKRRQQRHERRNMSSSPAHCPAFRTAIVTVCLSGLLDCGPAQYRYGHRKRRRIQSRRSRATAAGHARQFHPDAASTGTAFAARDGGDDGGFQRLPQSSRAESASAVAEGDAVDRGRTRNTRRRPAAPSGDHDAQMPRTQRQRRRTNPATSTPSGRSRPILD